MKLKEHYDALTKLLQDNPAAGEFDVVTATDDEGNGFNLVHYNPGVGVFEDGEFTPEEHFEDADTKPNAVCLN